VNYWRECISEAFDEVGITATQAQIDAVAEWVEGASENESTARGWDCIPDPMQEENARLRDELARERDKRICEHCNGKGSVTWPGPVHSATSDCTYCNGRGWK